MVDSGQPFAQTGEATVTIYVQDVNDKKPKFERVREGSKKKQVNRSHRTDRFFGKYYCLTIKLDHVAYKDDVSLSRFELLDQASTLQNIPLYR